MTHLRHVVNPPQRFLSEDIEWIDEAPIAETQIFEEECKEILSKNGSPDIPFKFSLNPYRGCFHACAYCYARPSHQYLDFGAGTDFERKIVAKINAPERLRYTFNKKSWVGDLILFSGNTDCYQPLEASYELTKRCLEVCRDFRNPVAIITKGAAIRRDFDLLSELNKIASLHVTISLAFTDDKMSKALEPGAARPSFRFAMIEELAKRGIPTGVGIAPIIPGLNESAIPEIIKRASECGATSAFMTLLRLPGEVKDVFIPRLEAAFPTTAQRVVNELVQLRGGRLNSSNFGERMKGAGEKWKSITWMFEQAKEKYGFTNSERFEVKNTFRRGVVKQGNFEF